MTEEDIWKYNQQKYNDIEAQQMVSTLYEHQVTSQVAGPFVWNPAKVIFRRR